MHHTQAGSALPTLSTLRLGWADRPEVEGYPISQPHRLLSLSRHPLPWQRHQCLLGLCLEASATRCLLTAEGPPGWGPPGWSSRAVERLGHQGWRAKGLPSSQPSTSWSIT